MTTEQMELWEKLKAFKIGPQGVALTFEKRLARENNWSEAYACQCVLEYKKFIFLIATLKQSFTPSDAIDQVWHLHLTYTDSYWNHLCSNLLNKQIHHGPTEGGRTQSHHFKRQYQQTLDIYRSYFGEPPTDVWPNVKDRFQNADHFVRVNKSNSLILKRPTASFFRLPILMSITGLLAACAGILGEEGSWTISETVIAIVVIMVILNFLFKARGSGGGKGGSGCSSFGGCSSDSGCSSSGCSSGCGGCGS